MEAIQDEFQVKFKYCAVTPPSGGVEKKNETGSQLQIHNVRERVYS